MEHYAEPAAIGWKVMYPPDVYPESGCRLPLPNREELDDLGRRTYDRLADPKGGTLRGLKGPGGI
jgi:4-carboxymuconolactone decarboxylase